MRVTRGGIHLIPPSQPDEPAASDVFQVVEIRREKEDCYDEDKDAGDQSVL